ncbi:AEC family transporter [Marinomonas sp. THO17]|uniref:AEC family transporter n=1 Tax=Marinomonas sp. THO17 TaxID=3149048 RepID=UPI00336BC8A2
MEVVLEVTAPIFLLVLIGFLAVRFGLIASEALSGLSRFVLYLALPALIFVNLSVMDIHEVFHPSYMLVYALGGIGSFFITVLIAAKMLRQNWIRSGVMGVGATMSNSAFIGFPVLLQFFDEPMTQAFAMALMVENIILLPVCLIFIETLVGHQKRSQKHHSVGLWRVVSKRIVGNPLLIALSAGLVFSLFDLPMPSFAQQSLEFLAAGAAPTALVVIGGALVGVSIKGQFSPILLVAIGKLLIFPLLVVLLLNFTPNMAQSLKWSVILFAAMPMFSTYPIICGEYGERSFCASTLLFTTVLSFLTLSLLLRFMAVS